MSPETTPAIEALQAAGTPHRVVVTRPAGSAEESAQLQGIELHQLLRTIVVRRAEDDYLFVLVPGGRRGVNIHLRPVDLVAALAATLIDVSREQDPA